MSRSLLLRIKITTWGGVSLLCHVRTDLLTHTCLVASVDLALLPLSILRGIFEYLPKAKYVKTTREANTDFTARYDFTTAIMAVEKATHILGCQIRCHEAHIAWRILSVGLEM
jgi:hypothetical protein